ncbi:hypothetical protein GCM10022600_15260 [Qipengyuania pelagi]|uniref:Uncharacterized protein n=1 Tax=Qipengyuania pelagi TaxID=994320 RepID=A0A844Y828_9SPHN|nr:hypothetical protein [Qipengyuania pelagi]MXO53619.1 hypothetical protein [Qipengyuania pelagi]
MTDNTKDEATQDVLPIHPLAHLVHKRHTSQPETSGYMESPETQQQRTDREWEEAAKKCAEAMTSQPAQSDLVEALEARAFAYATGSYEFDSPLKLEKIACEIGKAAGLLEAVKVIRDAALSIHHGEGEPVAWRYHYPGAETDARFQTYEGMSCEEEREGMIETPLYAHPTPTAPQPTQSDLVERIENWREAPSLMGAVDLIADLEGALSTPTVPQSNRAAVLREAVHVVFDGPPGPTAGRFVECETPDGKSINAGEWREREDGFWELVIARPTATQPDRERLADDLWNSVVTTNGVINPKLRKDAVAALRTPATPHPTTDTQSDAVREALERPAPTPCEEGGAHCCCCADTCRDCDQPVMLEPDWQNAETCLTNIAIALANNTTFSEDGPVDTVVSSGDLQCLFSLANVAAYVRHTAIRNEAADTGGEA